MARAAVSVVICGDGLVALFGIWKSTAGPWPFALGTGLLAALLFIQLFHFSRPGARLHSTRSYALLVAQGCLAYLPITIFGTNWIGTPSFVAGCVLLALPRRPAWIAFGAIVASTGWIQAAYTASMLDVVYTTLSVGLFGLDIYLLTRLASMAVELHTAQDKIARKAVSEERLRFARDLHDLLGLNLSAITLKGELAYQLTRKHPQRAEHELSEILDIARRALAEVRSVAGGYHELSLEQEANSAESVLTASRVDVRMDLDDSELPVPVCTLLGTVLREGVTNVVRHSKAEHCVIVIRQAADSVSLDIVNDGASDEGTPPSPTGGNGIRNLSDRVAALNGRTSAKREPNGWFRLQVRIPLPWAQPHDGAPHQSTKPSSQYGSTIDSMSAGPLDARLTQGLVPVVFSVMCVTAVMRLLYMTTDFWKIASSVGYFAALLALQLGYFSRSTTRLRSTRTYALLFVQAGLIYLPLLQLGAGWDSLPGFLVGNALLVLQAPLRWAVFAASIGATAWFHAAITGNPQAVAFNVVVLLIASMAVFGLTSLRRLVAELTESRLQLARMAIDEERLRFAVEVDTLLGLSLSAIALKTELAQRLLRLDSARAADQLVEILNLARQALADVRSVASGYRELSLDKEVRSAESLLTAADINVRMDLRYMELPVPTQTMLAVALRQAVTNIFRHSSAQTCEIVIRQATGVVTLDIVNDGVIQDKPDGASGSSRASAVHNLSDRVAKIGGQLNVRLEPDGRFRLRVSLPV